MAGWTESGDAGTTIRPLLDEYRGRVTFATRSGCPPTSGCPADSPQVAFELVNPPDYVEWRFEPPKVRVNETTGALFPSRSAASEILLKLTHDAPYNRAFTLQARGTCESGTSSVSRSFRVGPLVGLTADVVDLRAEERGIAWTVLFQNAGNVELAVRFHPRPSSGEVPGLNWSHPAQLTLAPQAATTASSFRENVTFRVTGTNLSQEYALDYVYGPVGRNGDEEALTAFIVLPYAIFEGEATPAAAAPLVVLLLAGAAAARRRT